MEYTQSDERHAERAGEVDLQSCVVRLVPCAWETKVFVELPTGCVAHLWRKQCSDHSWRRDERRGLQRCILVSTHMYRVVKVVEPTHPCSSAVRVEVVHVHVEDVSVVSIDGSSNCERV